LLNRPSTKAPSSSRFIFIIRARTNCIKSKKVSHIWPTHLEQNKCAVITAPLSDFCSNLCLNAIDGHMGHRYGSGCVSVISDRHDTGLG
jgi:hypothetical protein